MRRKMHHRNYLIRNRDIEITKREVISSIVIIAFMLIVGLIISGIMTDIQNDKNSEYQKAIQISDSEMFEYGMDTDVGNAFVYGDLLAVDSVTFDEIGGAYLYINKEEQHYNMHTRTVIDYDKNGKEIGSHEETYYSWDYYDDWTKHSKRILFCGVEFSYDNIKIPKKKYITTISESNKVRYEYYGVVASHTGTIYAKLENNSIPKQTKFYDKMNIEETLEYLTSGIGRGLFWIIWILLIAVMTYMFYSLDNRWLEG